MDIYVVMVHAKPKPDNEESKTCGGAYINCWIQAADLDEAVARAHARASEEGWVADELHTANQVHREYYDPVEDAEELESFDEAVACGEAAILYTYPIEDEE